VETPPSKHVRFPTLRHGHGRFQAGWLSGALPCHVTGGATMVTLERQFDLWAVFAIIVGAIIVTGAMMIITDWFPAP